MKNIITILPRRPWPPYAGQSRLAYYRSKELKKNNYNTTLIWFDFFTNNLSKSELYKLKKAYKIIKKIDINFLDLFFIFFNALKNRIFKKTPLQASLIDSPLIKKKINSYFKSIDADEKKNYIIHCYSIRTYSIWRQLNEIKINFVLDLVDSMKLNIN